MLIIAQLINRSIDRLIIQLIDIDKKYDSYASSYIVPKNNLE